LLSNSKDGQVSGNVGDDDVGGGVVTTLIIKSGLSGTKITMISI
jgi:hypothetical protein